MIYFLDDWIKKMLFDILNYFNIASVHTHLIVSEQGELIEMQLIRFSSRGKN